MGEPERVTSHAPVSYERGQAPGRPPLLLGCAAALAVLVAIVGAGACAVVFLESGADSGTFQLEDADAYVPSSVEFIGDRNVFLVRTLDGAYFALLDLDAANRANQGRRCRVQLVPKADPGVVAIQSRYQAQFSPKAAGLPIIFRETCNGATYDATGVRLDGEGARNLDRYRVEVAANGRVEVTASRICTERSEASYFAEVDCDQPFGEELR